MNFASLLDILISVLLVTTIVWCVLLNRRLGGLRKNQSELATLIAELNLATSRAESGITVLKTNAEEAGASLQTSIDHAERLNDDLAYLSERGSRLVERLDEPTKRARHAAFAGKNTVNFEAGKKPFEPGPDIRDFEAGKRPIEPGPEIRDDPPEAGKRDGLIDLLSGDEMPDFTAPDGVAPMTDPARKNLERRLLDALKAAR
jgi:hypothetical protein